MIRVALGGFAVVVVIVVALLLLELCRSPSSSRGPVTRETNEDTRGTSPALPKPSLPRARADDDAGRERSLAVIRQETRTFLARDLPHAIVRAASSCYRGQEGTNERMTLRYQLRLEGGRATVEDVAVVKSELSDRALEDCVVEALESFEMRRDEAPDAVESLSITISTLALQRQARGLR